MCQRHRRGPAGSRRSSCRVRQKPFPASAIRRQSRPRLLQRSSVLRDGTLPPPVAATGRRSDSRSSHHPAKGPRDRKRHITCGWLPGRLSEADGGSKHQSAPSVPTSPCSRGQPFSPGRVTLVDSGIIIHSPLAAEGSFVLNIGSLNEEDLSGKGRTGVPRPSGAARQTPGAVLRILTGRLPA